MTDSCRVIPCPSSIARTTVEALRIMAILPSSVAEFLLLLYVLTY